LPPGKVWYSCLYWKSGKFIMGLKYVH
jgi:hypothetical protein